MDVGNNIKQLRKQKGLRQEQLAEAMGVSTASVSKWETNQTYPELTLLVELADFFEVSIDTLCGHNLSSNRFESLIDQMKKTVNDRNEENAASLCEKLLRNYPNNDRAIEACADSYYKLYIYTGKKNYMELCIEQTKRLMNLKQGEPEQKRLERIHYLGNQYELLEKWDIAKEYYEQSNVSGSSDPAIAGCLLNQGKAEEAIIKLSNFLVESIFHQYQAVNRLADGWTALREDRKACDVLEWMYGVMEALHYNPTTMILLQIKLAGLYGDSGRIDMMENAMRKAAILAKETDDQEISAEADFIHADKAREMLISTPRNKELVMNVANAFGSAYAEIVHQELQ